MKDNIKGSILIILSTIGYSIMPLLSIKAKLNNNHILSILFTRFLIATIILWAIVLIKKLKFFISIKNTLFIVFISVFGFSLTSITLYISYEYLSSSLATLILFSHPIIITIIEYFLKKKMIETKKIFAIIFTSLGLILILFTGDKINVKGLILTIISSFAYSLYCIGLSKKEIKELHPLTINAYVTLLSSVSIGIFMYIRNIHILPSNLDGYIASFNLAIFSTILATVFFIKGVSLIGPSTSALISTIEPLLVAILGVAFLNETMTLNIILGGFILILGIIILEIDFKKLKKSN